MGRQRKAALIVKILGNRQRRNQVSLWASFQAEALEIVAQKGKET